MAKIKIDTLMTRLADSEISDEELATYFLLDDEISGPFSPLLKINPDTVIVPGGLEGDQRSAQALNLANFFSRIRRQSRFNKKISNGYKGPVIVSEGDSWFQYPLLLKDTIDHLADEYAIYSLGAAGDLLQSMAKKREHIGALRDTGASILLFSGGGNDLVAGGALADHLEVFDKHLEAADYLKPSFQSILDNAFGHYERIFRDVHGSAPHVQVICHGYDYAIPDNGRWLGKPFARQKIKDHGLQRDITKEMMDRFNRGLLRLCATMPHVTYINCRRTVGDSRWHDELHPTNEGYRDVAQLFSREIRSLQSQKSAPIIAIPGSFGRSVSESMLNQRAVEGESEQQIAGRGMSLHVGLNSVDPDHYANWSGVLRACENDALAMTQLAQSQGFKTETLLTQAATRDAVVAGIKSAAKNLEAGEMFLMSVSAHGGKLPDLNKDEVDDGDDPHDETLLLYDFMIADDELYALWSEFAPGVRVVLVADTCHSGSMVRANPFDTMLLGGGEIAKPENEFRFAPKHITTRTYFQHQRDYMKRADQFSQIREEVINNPLMTPVKASVLNLGACRDSQFARDGEEYGAFTGALLKVWNQGNFNGNYKSFMSQITTLINRPDQTPTIKQVGADDAGYLLQKPFSVWSALTEFNRPENKYGDVVDAPLTVNSVVPTEVSSGSGIAFLNQEESQTEDPLSDSDLSDLFERKADNIGDRSASAAASWSLYESFRNFIDALSLTNFIADEFLILGGSHHSSTSSCFDKNTFPPEHLWPNVIATARILDTLRDRLGSSIVITNAYREPVYNSCIGGAKSSQHLRFNALDFAVKGMKPVDYAVELRRMRDEEKLFHGGVGLYNTFVHIDTRGVNATWPGTFA